MVKKLKCGCVLDFAETYAHLIVVGECEKHKYDKSVHYAVSRINELLDILEEGGRFG